MFSQIASSDGEQFLMEVNRYSSERKIILI